MRILKGSRDLKYTAVTSNGELKRPNLAGLMYVNDVCLFAESAEGLQRVYRGSVIMYEYSFDEYGLKVSEISLKWSV